ncbi:MAG: class I SAM-dependent methyltransferase [Candidatus Obscuribacterales bacterium]|nr:class I SAM-dependent methyltransferase [Candidatus Obscuribacterales bacterium]
MQVNWDERYIQSDTPWDSGVPSQALKTLLAEGKVKPTRALELGCGTGTNAIFLAQQGFDVTAVDLSSEALKHAREKAIKAKVKINFVEADVTNLPDLGEAFPFIFDRGTYHIVRKVNLAGFQAMLATMVAPLGFYYVLTGNANTLSAPDQGPPVVRADEIVAEIEFKSFDLVELKRTIFNGVKIAGKEVTPLAWAALFQKRSQSRN